MQAIPVDDPDAAVDGPLEFSDGAGTLRGSSGEADRTWGDPRAFQPGFQAIWSVTEAKPKSCKVNLGLADRNG